MDTYGGETRPSIAKAVIVGGLVGGILGAVPLIQNFNCCCCIWFALGGVIAVLIYRASASFDITTGMGALLGLVSGLIAGVLTGIGQYFTYMVQLRNPEFWDPKSELNQGLRDAMSQAGSGEFVDQYFQILQNMNPDQMMGWVFLGLVFMIVLGTIVSVIAGIITAAAAGKKRTLTDEPPPYQPTV